MKKTTITFKSYSNLADNTTTTSRKLAEAIDMGVKKMFTGKISLPMPAIIGHALASLNEKGLVEKNVLDSFDMDADYAETLHSKLLNTVVGHAIHALARYGDIISTSDKKKDGWTTHWTVNLNEGIFLLLDRETKKYVPVTLKKLRKAKVQKRLSNNLGISTLVEGVDKEYLEAIASQYVEFRVNKKELVNALKTEYCESELLMNGDVKYKKTLRTDTQVEEHTKNILAMDGKMFPISEKLETRGRSAKQLESKKGLNFYGRTWETQSFRLGDVTEAYDARQSGYGIMSVLLSIMPVAKITGIYGDTGLGDLYTDLFMKALSATFNVDLIEKLGANLARDVAKRPAQMLAYMAGMLSILTNETKNFGSIWSHLGSDDMDMEEMCITLEKELNRIPELEPIMELRTAVRDGHVDNKAMPSWRLPESSLYHFTRSDTSYIDWDGTKSTPKFTFVGDGDKRHTMSAHFEMFRSKAKYSAILAAIIHSIDAWIKKKVTLDVIAAGGKCVVKHDEFVVDKEHAEVMNKSYHKWMAYVGENKTEFLQKPLRSCGYLINLDSMVKTNEDRFGKFDTTMVASATEGLAYEWSC